MALNSKSKFRERIRMNLKCGIISVPTAKDLEGIIDFPFVDSLFALEKLIKLLPNAQL